MEQSKQQLILLLVSFFLFFNFQLSGPLLAEAKNLEKGKKLFFSNCNVCHLNGTNLILSEKDLRKETLELNGMNTKESITYQIINGKNGMPAFGGRLQENDIDEIALYLLEAPYPVGPFNTNTK
jgi:cytochrome c6